MRPGLSSSLGLPRRARPGATWRIGRVTRRELASAAAVVALALLVGIGVAAGRGLLILYAIVMLVCVALGLRRWQWSVLALLVFLPYSGLLILAAYPDTGPATLVKDLLFVIPAYIGFAASYLLRRAEVRVPGFPLGCALLLSIVVVLQIANPAVPGIVVGLIGAKVWLMYIPMAYLGYHLVRTREDLRRVLSLICVAGIVPAIVGIVEGVIVNSGHPDVVYRWYGAAAAAATQDFAVVGEGTLSISRVASTFSFVGQYFLFTIAMLAASYAYWRGFLTRSHRTAGFGMALFMLVVLASLLSGARGAILFVPAMIVVMLALDGVRLRLSMWLALGAGAFAALAFAASVFGASLSELLTQVFDHALGQLAINTIDGFRHAHEHMLVGLGTGVDTQAARHALPDLNPFALVGGRVEESWWVKLVLELGIAGLLLGVALIATVTIRVCRSHRRLRDPQLRSVSAGLLALVLFLFINNFKGSYLDLDPTNVLFWLFVGILLKLPALDVQDLAATGATGSRSGRGLALARQQAPRVGGRRSDVVAVGKHDLAHSDAERAGRAPAHPRRADQRRDHGGQRGAGEPERR